MRNDLDLNAAYDTGRGLVTSTMMNNIYADHILRITLSVTETTNTATSRNTGIDYFVTNNDGSNWFGIAPGKAFDFPTLGNDIRWKARLRSLSGHLSPKLSTLTLTEIPVSIDIDGVLAFRDNFDTLDTKMDGYLSFEESGLATWGEFYAYDLNKNSAISDLELLKWLSELYGPAVVYLDFDYVGSESGTLTNPFNTLLEAATIVGESGMVSIASGSTSEVIYINKDVTIEASGGTVTIGATP